MKNNELAPGVGQPEIVGIAGFEEKLAELEAFSPAITQRVLALQLGLSPNGHTPDATLEIALSGKDKSAESAFLHEYAWAVDLAIYPYNHRPKDKKQHRAVAELALFQAGRSYDVKRESNFLVHFSSHVQQKLKEWFGQPRDLEVPKIEQFDGLVTGSLAEPVSAQAAEIKEVSVVKPLRLVEVVKESRPADWPPLATEQRVADFQVNDEVRHLNSKGELVISSVKSVTANEVDYILGPAPPEEKLAEFQAAVDQQDWSAFLKTYVIGAGEAQSWGGAFKVTRESGKRNKATYVARNETVYAEGYGRTNDLNYRGGSPSAEALRVLGLLTVEGYPQLVPQPSPGFVHLVSYRDPVGLITDINHNYVIPMPAWQKIREDATYREAWLSNGSPESLRRSSELRAAIGQAINQEVVKTARLHNHRAVKQKASGRMVA